MSRRAERLLAPAAAATAWATVLLLFVGALVTSTRSGLSVPDWPTSFGVGMFDYPLARMAGGVVFEHSHRLLASLVGLVTAILVVGIGLTETRRWVKALAALALVSVVVQGILGGATVLLGTPRAVSTAHTLLGQSFFVILFLIAASLSPEWRNRTPNGRDIHLAVLFGVLSLAVFLQIGLGAWLRHAKPLVPAGDVTRHILGAVLVYALVGLTGARAEKGAGRRIALRLALFGILQILLGFASLAAGSEGGVLVRSFHLVLGAWIFAYAALGLAEGLRPFRNEIGSFLTRSEAHGGDLAVLFKVRLVALVVATAGAGHLIETGPAHFGRLLALLLGTGLLAAGAAAANETIEAASDALMKRTAGRPVASGRISRRTAATLSAVASIPGLALLLPVGGNVFALGLLAWVSYVFLYTPVKRISILNTLIGAVPGALPVLMGSLSGADGTFTPLGVNLFALLYVWQIPHFLAIAWIYREEFAGAGFAMLGSSGEDDPALLRQALLGALALLPISLFPAVHAGLGWLYLLPALGAGIFFLIQGLILAAKPSEARARGLFRYSLAYCPAVLLLLFLVRWH